MILNTTNYYQFCTLMIHGHPVLVAKTLISYELLTIINKTTLFNTYRRKVKQPRPINS